MSKKRRRKSVSLLLFLISVFCLFGCGSGEVQNSPENSFYERSAISEEELVIDYQDSIDKIYQNAMERFMDPNAIEELEGSDVFDRINRKFLSGYHRTYRVFRSISPVIIVCSVAIGILMMVLARRNKKVKRTGLMVFVIGIPAAVIIAVFGIGVMNGVLLY